ncbi:MAG TPA: sugar phosphate isomerase/epimerase, partial [Candidatus Latescibacteria bacterium]|nr:sugar phosphate isomerase/epimerase [Candidatus Latescibacterota bacterium]
PLAEELDIPVGMENHQDICSWELCRLCEQVGSPSLGVTMDVGNALAVGETCSSFARRVMPYLKHVHLKDYKVYPTSSGYRLKRCPLGSGVVDWPDMLGIFRDGAPRIEACIELGATTARHIRILEPDYWSTFPQRPLEGVVDAIRTLHQASSDGDWRTPHERGEDADVRSAYELDQLETSVSYLKEIGGLPG